jgi:hypothetical protein
MLLKRQNFVQNHDLWKEAVQMAEVYLPITYINTYRYQQYRLFFEA